MINITATDALRQCLARVRGFVLDLDGTLGLTEQGRDGFSLFPGSREFLDKLKDKNIPFVIFTNGTFFPAAHYVRLLGDAGLHIDAEQIVTPSTIAAQYLSNNDKKNVLVLGGNGATLPLIDAGLTVIDGDSEDVTDVDAVYVAWHPDMVWQDVENACHAIWQGAEFYVASKARFFAAKSGRRVGISAAIAAAITNTTEKDAILLGKPSLEALHHCSAIMGGIELTDIAVVGDDPILEPALAHCGGGVAIGVLTGLGQEQDFQQLSPANQPHVVVNDIAELSDIYPDD